MTYEQLGELAKQTVIKVMQEGEKKYPGNDFMERDVLDHSHHLAEHAFNFNSGFQYDKEEITHIMARATIILAKLEQNQENPQN